MPNFDLRFMWIGDRSVGHDRCAINLKLKLNDVEKSEDNYFNLSARKERYLPMKTRTGLSLLISMQIKNPKKIPLQAFFGRINKVN